MIKKIIFSLVIFAVLIFGLLQLQFVQNQLADYTVRSQIYNALVENSNMPSEDAKTKIDDFLESTGCEKMILV